MTIAEFLITFGLALLGIVTNIHFFKKKEEELENRHSLINYLLKIKRRKEKKK